MPSDREDLIYLWAMHRAFNRGSLQSAADVREEWDRRILSERGTLPDKWQNRMTAVFGAYGKVATAVAGEADPAEMMDATQARDRAWSRLLEVVGAGEGDGAG